jgi:hypothetical protein
VGSSSGLNNCNQSSKADGWLATAFTEPTLANGAAYVPSACVVTGTATTVLHILMVDAEPLIGLRYALMLVP